MELPPLDWTIGISFISAVTIPFGNISDYFQGQGGIGLEIPVSYRNIVLTPSVSLAWGRVKTSFTYDGDDWNKGDVLTARILDLSLGYRAKLLPDFSVVPQIGLGLLKLWYVQLEEEGECWSWLKIPPCWV